MLNARGGLRIGDHVHISSHVIIHTGGLIYSATRENRTHTQQPVVIGDGAWICAGAIINPGVTIGENSVIGSGAVVTKDVPANVVVAGVPAVYVKDVN